MDVSQVKEFLNRKGPAGIPYWGLGAMGVAVIAGTIWLQRSGALSNFLAPSTASSDLGAGGGSGAGGIPPDNTPPGALPPGASEAPPAPSQPPLVGQQEGTTSGGLSSPPPGPVGVNQPLPVVPIYVSQPAEPGVATPISYTFPQSVGAPIGGVARGVQLSAQQLGQVGARLPVFANPVPVTQTQIVQYRPPTTGGTRSGPQFQ
jgi:hypothetical protein